MKGNIVLRKAGCRPSPQMVLKQKIMRNWVLYLMLLPAVLLVFCFSYIPMYGVSIAFKDYKNALGILGSPWADPVLKHFLRFFRSYQFSATIRNTLVISLYSMAVSFPFPILLALLINQMHTRRFRRFFQTVTYMPYFISTVVLVGMMMILLSPSTGIVGNVSKLLHRKAPNVMGEPSWFSTIYVWSGVWQSSGWDSIIYLAALSAVDPTLYEAATVDGAGKFRKLLHIDIPMLLPTACILLILRAGNIMNVGFEKVYLMQNDLNLSVSEVIHTYVYKLGVQNAQYSISAAVSLFNNAINCALLVLINQVTRRLGESSLW